MVLGCGPQPEMIKALRQRGFHAVGVEPVPSSVETARRYVGQPDSILLGAAEKIPLSDESQQLVVCLYVLEHVDSPVRCLSEMNRVLVPGGVNVIYTTNRHHISLLGRNGEFSIPYYNWFPDLLKECYVHHHLHFDPQLANYTTRPAVHWFCYSALCKLGRDACFSQFYSIIDVLRVEDPLIAKSPFRRFLLPRLQRSPWLRALALTQVGGMVLMVKRPA